MKKIFAIFVFSAVMTGGLISCANKETATETETEQQTTENGIRDFSEQLKPLIDGINSHVFYSTGTGLNTVRIHEVIYSPEENCVFVYLGEDGLYWAINNGHVTEEPEILDRVKELFDRFDGGDFRELLNFVDKEKIGLVCYITPKGNTRTCAYAISLNDYQTPLDCCEEYYEDEFQPDSVDAAKGQLP